MLNGEASDVDGRLLHSLTFGDALRQNRRSFPQHLAVISEGREFTYPQLDDRVNRLAHVYRSHGVVAGDRILWLGQNSHRLLEAILAASKCGAMVAPANWQMEADALAHVIADAEPKVVLWQENALAAKVAAIRAAYPQQAAWIQHDGSGDDSYESLLARAPADDPETYVDPNGALLVMYTAAFDGRPNGALLSQVGLMLHGMVVAAQAGVDDNYVYLNCGPMYRLGILWSTLSTLHMGGTNVFIPRADAKEICVAIERYKCNGAMLLEPIFSEVVATNRVAKHDLSSFLSSPGNAEWSAMTTLDPMYREGRTSQYGQTEVNGLLTRFAYNVEGLHGRAVPVAQMRVVDDDDNEVEPGEVGEIVARGPTAMLGYFRRPELNARLQRGGWHHTNDLGRREKDGSLTYISSKSRLMKSGIENLYPAEIEACLLQHPAVAKAAVIGVPDATSGGQTVKAVIVLNADTKATADDLIAHCQEHLAGYKAPRSIDLVAELPMRGGAIDYDAVDRDHGGGGYPGSQTFRKITGL